MAPGRLTAGDRLEDRTLGPVQVVEVTRERTPASRPGELGAIRYNVRVKRLDGTERFATLYGCRPSDRFLVERAP